MDGSQPRLVNAETLAKAMHLTVRRTQQLVKDGMPKADRGIYNQDECMSWYVRYLQKALERRSPRTGTGDETFSEAKLRQAQAEASLKELQLAKQRSEVIEIETAGRLWSNSIERMRSKLIASINATAVRCVGLANIAQAHGVLREMVNAALAEVDDIASDVETGTDTGADG